MIWQLRTYRLHPGAAEGFVAFWSTEIVPLRERLGYVVKGGWLDAPENVFVWLVGHEAPDGWDAAEQDYYADPRRTVLSHDPREFVAEHETRLLQEVQRHAES